MQCYHISTKRAFFIILTFVINGVQHTQLSDNNMDTARDASGKNVNFKDNARNHQLIAKPSPEIQTYSSCSAFNDECLNFSDPCINCTASLSSNCTYGKTVNATCVTCKGGRTYNTEYVCRYCYQTEPWEHTCVLKANCNSVAINRSQYTTNCTVKDHILCLGSRTFYKNVHCNWTGGYRWSTALILSITLGGFGADRFYLGHWQEGIGKLFSFGGLGVWTLIDVILISLHYLGPADGSLYI